MRCAVGVRHSPGRVANHQARQRFLATAHTPNLAVDSYVLPAYQGAANEVLAADAALFNAEHARSLLILNSAVHGSKGFVARRASWHF